MISDEKFMQEAILLAERGEGRTSPNPLVGCVIVNNGKVIARGWHKAYGGDHAETDALKKAGPRAAGATMYVTLEPCFHQGHTPPCVKAVLAAGLRKVVIAMKDPNPLTNGKSIRLLRTRGVEVVLGVCEEPARDMNLAFIKYIQHKMPYVVAKTAQTMDGKAGLRTGRHWITAGKTRALAKKRRHAFDAIVVGVNTVLMDDPQLDAPDKRIVKVVVDSRLRTPLAAKLFKTALPGQVILATTSQASPARVAAFWKMGVRVMICAQQKGGKIDLKALFKGLAKNGLIRILIEGGPELVASALKGKLVDRMHIYIAPRLLLSRDAVVGVDIAQCLNSGQFEPLDVKRMGRDIFLECDVASNA